MTTSAASPSDAPVTHMVAEPPPPSATPESTATDGDERGRFRLGHRPELDGLRGIAVLLVFVHHTGQLLWPSRADWLIPAGYIGVDLFFALSGFLITVLLVADGDRYGRVRLGAFAVRRIRRLVPLLVAVLAAAGVLAATDQIYQARAVRNSVFTVLSFTHNWALVEGWPVTLGYLWTVSVEGQFYALWALVVFLAVRSGRTAPVLALVGAIGVIAACTWRWVQFEGGQGGFSLYLSTPSRLDAPLMGSLIGVVAVTGWLPALRGRAAALAGTVALLALLGTAAYAKGLDDNLFRGLFTLIALGASTTVLAAVRASPDGWFRRVLRVRWLVGAGIVSYSLYVWHYIVFDLVVANSETWRAPVRAAVGVSVSLVLAVLSYRCIERPFLRRPSRKPDQGATPDANGKQRSASEPNAYIS